MAAGDPVRRKPDKLVVVCTVICLLCLLPTAFAVAPSVLGLSKRTDDIAKLSKENAARTREVARLARAIQDQRAESIRRNCKAQNRRHDNTIRALDVLLAKVPAGPERDRAKARRQGTVFLLNRIVPHQNCRELVAKSAPTP